MTPEDRIAQFKVVVRALAEIQELERLRSFKDNSFDAGVCAGLKSANRILTKKLLEELNNE